MPLSAFNFTELDLGVAHIEFLFSREGDDSGLYGFETSAVPFAFVVYRELSSFWAK